MRKAVVVGGSGFIGSHVADHLSEAGYEVTIYDKNNSRWARPDQKMVIGDVLETGKLNQCIADSGADVVYNFAALADLNLTLRQPAQTISINILGNVNVMEACRLHGVNRFIYASTVYVHSREGGFYRCSKQSSESYIEEYYRTYGLEYSILRYGSLYGSRADETNGLWRIINSSIKDGNIRYTGNPNAMREYIHVEDAARASVDVLSDDFVNESIVLTGQEPMRVMDLLRMLAEILGMSQDSIEFIEDDQVGHYIRTPYAYQSKLGKKFIPPVHVDLGQGLLQMINELKAES